MTDVDRIFTLAQHFPEGFSAETRVFCCSVCSAMVLNLQVHSIKHQTEEGSAPRQCGNEPPARPVTAGECPRWSVVAGERMAVIKTGGVDGWRSTDPFDGLLSNSDVQSYISSGAKIIRVGR